MTTSQDQTRSQRLVYIRNRTADLQGMMRGYVDDLDADALTDLQFAVRMLGDEITDARAHVREQIARREVREQMAARGTPGYGPKR